MTFFKFKKTIPNSAVKDANTFASNENDNNPHIVEANGKTWYHSNKNLVVYDLASKKCQVATESDLLPSQFVYLFGVIDNKVLGLIKSSDFAESSQLVVYELTDGTLSSLTKKTYSLGRYRAYAGLVAEREVAIAAQDTGDAFTLCKFPVSVVNNAGNFIDFNSYVTKSTATVLHKIVALGYYQGDFYLLARVLGDDLLLRFNSGAFTEVLRSPPLPKHSKSMMLEYKGLLLWLGKESVHYYDSTKPGQIGNASLDFGMPTPAPDHQFTSFAISGDAIYFSFDKADALGVIVESWNQPLVVGISTRASLIDVDGNIISAIAPGNLFAPNPQFETSLDFKVKSKK